MRMQRMLSNGSWIDDNERLDEFVGYVVVMEQWYAPRQNREPMTTQGVLDALLSGKQIQYDQDWYAQIRDGETYDRLIAERKAKQKPVTETLCACGHYSAHSMNTSSGISCPDCYDRMSD